MAMGTATGMVPGGDPRDTLDYLEGLETRALVRQVARYRAIGLTRGLLPAEGARLRLIERVLRGRTDGAQGAQERRKRR